MLVDVFEHEASMTRSTVMIENRHMASLPLRVMFIFTASMTVGDKCEEQCLGRGQAAM